MENAIWGIYSRIISGVEFYFGAVIMRAMKLKKNLRKNKSVVLVAGVALVAFALMFWQFGIRSTVVAPRTFIINRGASVGAVARSLHQHNMVISPTTFKMAVRMNGGRVQSGEYDIPRGISSWGLARMFANGNIATTTVTIPEGMTVKQIKQLLLNASNLTGGVECGDDKSLPVCNLRDGDLFPDTYRVARGTSRLAVLELMRKKMIALETEMDRYIRRLPKPLKTWDEVIVLASIVQKETPRESEMPMVASVYINRLNKGMRLQADPTVVYAITNGLGDMQGAPLLRSHLGVDSPYNTYKKSGLPPAPIANVGRSAVSAVLKPADTKYLYFVADGQGGHKFARDYETHQKNHAAWRKIKNKI